MNIVVTGGVGFVGTNLIKRLIEDGHDVVSIDNYSTGSQLNHQKDCFYLTHDITKITDYSFLKPDIIFHMAAIARIQPSFKDPLNYFETNATGTLKIAQYCAENNVPLIYAGSSSHHSGKFKNPYTFSKDIGEEITQLFNQHFGLKSSIARFYNVYGPHQLTKGGYATLIGRWLNNIENGHECEIYGDGSKRRDFTHVDDIVDGLIKIMLNQSFGHVFEFGRGKNYSVNEVADMFNIKPKYTDDKPGEAQETLADYSLAKQKLNWEPKKNLKDYIDNL
tara:strand:- start:190 stop:1023 length:834 start_codon:yes stop_codon:yes gene_type:complete